MHGRAYRIPRNPARNVRRVLQIARGNLVGYKALGRTRNRRHRIMHLKPAELLKRRAVSDRRVLRAHAQYSPCNRKLVTKIIPRQPVILNAVEVERHSVISRIHRGICNGIVGAFERILCRGGNSRKHGSCKPAQIIPVHKSRKFKGKGVRRSAVISVRAVPTHAVVVYRFYHAQRLFAYLVVLLGRVRFVVGIIQHERHPVAPHVLGRFQRFRRAASHHIVGDNANRLANRLVARPEIVSVFNLYSLVVENTVQPAQPVILAQSVVHVHALRIFGKYPAFELIPARVGKHYGRLLYGESSRPVAYRARLVAVGTAVYRNLVVVRVIPAVE